MKKLITNMFILLLISVLFFTGCSNQKKEADKESKKELHISAAASLKDSLESIKDEYESKEDVELIFNFESSGTLQKQIEEGANVDLFISAGKKQMDALSEKDLILKDSRKNLLTNDLVLISSKEYKEKIKDIKDLTNIIDSKIAIGNPETVPAGQYASEALTNLNLMDQINQKLVLAKDVRQVLAYVEKGEVAAGVVYKSDASLMKSGNIVYIFPKNSHKEIIYPISIIKSSKNKKEIQKFEDYLGNKKSKEIFEKFGFEMSKN